MLKTYKIVINGLVQGVGFRPFVFTTAQFYGLKGYVTNNEEGVIILVSGVENEIEKFYADIVENSPPVARIQSHEIIQIDEIFFREFKIIPTKKDHKLNLQLTPDFGLCADCKDEILDASNRRYLYPFTTCVNCGPRWSITKTFSFERENTSIQDFKMCNSCAQEYTNPSNRRFHSQTNTCSDCGIKLVLESNDGKELQISQVRIFSDISTLIKSGNIIAIRNTGGYLLCCDASNKAVIKRLRSLKKRPSKPLAVLYPSLDYLEAEFAINEFQRTELCSAERPIVIVSKNEFSGNLASDQIAPGLNQLGLMLPYSGLLELLTQEFGGPLIATSGNIHGSPIISDIEEARSSIGVIADYFVHHALSIINAQDDSVVKFSYKFHHKVLFRRSRGYAPNYVEFRREKSEKIMAMGSHLKSSIAFIPNDFMYVSQYLGNLDHFDVYQRFVQTGFRFIEIFEQTPQVIIVDKHRAYLSRIHGSDLSKKYGSTLYEVQHHKAHFASVLGEHKLFDIEDSVMGVVWDGTGYGDDGQIWGGEFFEYKNHGIRRITHLDYFDWIAGDKMAREPRLSFLSLASLREKEIVATKFTEADMRVYRAVKARNELKTSSMGRLFDAVASLTGLCDINTYEGEAAILMENYVSDYILDSCNSYCDIENDVHMPTHEIWANICSDHHRGVPRETIIINFLFTLAKMTLELAKAQAYKKIAFSGGVFQNTTLIDMIKEMAGNQYELYFNRNLPPNDENISYGQLMYYLHCRDETERNN